MKKCRSCDCEVEETSDAELCPKCLDFSKMLNAKAMFDALEAAAEALDQSLMFGDSATKEQKEEWSQARDEAWKLLREIEK